MGMGHVPQDPIRPQGPRPDVQRRQRRGASAGRDHLEPLALAAPPQGASLANNARGRWGESVAADWYRQRGYQIVDRNWRCSVGELDIVAAGYGMTVFCEVKTRASDRFGTGADAVDHRKQARLRRLAVEWLRHHHGFNGQLRFDVAVVTGVVLTVVQDAF